MERGTKILEYAQRMGETANYVEKVGDTPAGKVYSLSFLDDTGLPMPVGLPRLVVVKGDKYNLITGETALELIASFGFEE